jgi:hypothetical protein
MFTTWHRFAAAQHITTPVVSDLADGGIWERDAVNIRNGIAEDAKAHYRLACLPRQEGHLAWSRGNRVCQIHISRSPIK